MSSLFAKNRKAVNQRAYRERLNCGLRCYKVEVDKTQLIAFLRDHHYLGGDSSNEAIEEALAAWIEAETTV